MSYTNILIHAVWSTKLREPVLSKSVKDAVCEHIRMNAKAQSIEVINVNGWKDHLHCFLRLDVEQNIANVMNLLKGESSYWANKNLELVRKLKWQKEYFAVSVSKSHFGVVNRYIERQEVHHQKNIFKRGGLIGEFEIL